MTVLKILGILLAALLLQMTLARFTVGGRWLFDLVLVATVYAALSWGPGAGILAGTLGGLTQDVLSHDIVGVGGLAKTLVGFVSGLVGAQLVVARPWARMLVVAVASAIHRVVIVAIYGVIDQRWPGVSWGAMLGETALNSLCGWAAFVATESLPAALGRGRQGRRTRWSGRTW